MTKKLGFKTKRIDFNESGKGKDQCDRESAISKKHIHAWIGTGKNVTNANEIKDGVFISFKN